MAIFLITFVLVVAVIAAMAVGVMFGRGSIKGSCGGANGGIVFVFKSARSDVKANTSGHSGSGVANSGINCRMNRGPG